MKRLALALMVTMTAFLSLGQRTLRGGGQVFADLFGHGAFLVSGQGMI